MRQHPSSFNPFSSYWLTESNDKTILIVVFCHVRPGHQKSIHQVVLVYGPLFYLQKLLPVARCRMQLPTLAPIARLQPTWLSSTLILCCFVIDLNRRSATIRSFLRPTDTHIVTRAPLRRSANSLLQLTTSALLSSVQEFLREGSAHKAEQGFKFFAKAYARYQQSARRSHCLRSQHGRCTYKRSRQARKTL